MREVSLTGGQVAKVDDADWPLVAPYRWRIRSGRYAVTTLPMVNCVQGPVIRMHRLIMRPAPEMIIDHINGDGLDNRRANLRVCHQRDNMRNRISGGATSAFKGVWAPARVRRPKWVAQIHIDRRKIYLGRFDTEVEAALAYDKAARRHFGAFARLNFPRPGEQPALFCALARTGGGEPPAEVLDHTGGGLSEQVHAGNEQQSAGRRT